ncbi:MAG: aldo/keto reductase [Thiotrichales bacterium]|nr:MAG: aldo/keto reductase [Thiotrichales bacterium]
MKLRALGSTGIDVSPLGLGTVKIGRNEQVKYPQGFEIPGDADVRGLLMQAWDLGINFIDTAPAYGNSEQRLGQLLPHADDWVIMTKVGEIFENGKSRFDFTAEHTRRSVERSLKKLNRDSVDIVLVHSDGNDMDIIENQAALETLEKMKQQGLIRAFGMSTKTVEGGLWVVEHTDVVMATFNLETDAELPVIERALALNKGVVIKKGLQSGHAESVEDAFRYVLTQPGVSSMIVGTINPEHLRSNVEICNRVTRNLD